MSAKTNTKKGSKSVFRTTDKCVQAEMKNKVEIARLQLQIRILDRQKSYNSFSVEKEKRQALAALAKMRTTSGLSMHGLAPEGPSDRTHEDSPYFKSYRPLSEKRLIRWRAKEKEVQRMLQKEEDVLVPPWEKDPNEDLSQKFGNMMRMLGYSVEDDDMRKLMKKEENPPSQEKPLNGFRPQQKVDPFECLKEDMGEADDNDAGGFSSLKPKKFSVEAWAKNAIENYVTSIAGEQQKAKSAPSRMEGDKTENVSAKPKAVWASAVNGLTVEKDLPPRPPSNIVRPHTASGASRRRLLKENLKRRPSSADRATKTRKPSYRSLRFATYTNSMNDSSEATTLNTVDEIEAQLFDAENAKPIRDQTCESRKTGGIGSNVRKMSPEAENGNLQFSPKSDGETSEQKADSNAQTHESLFLINTLLNADKKRSSRARKVSFNEDQHEDERPKIQKRVKSVQQLVKLTKGGSTFSNYDMKALEKNLEDISGLKNNHVPELFKRMPENRERRTKKDLHITKAERRIALHSQRYRKKELDPLDDVLASDEDASDGEGGDLIRRLPQWKRDLMAEAPPGLFGPRSPAKVVVAMSKSQRKRELDALVRENISDVKKIVEQENARRIRDRLHIYFTMRKLNEAATKISGNELPS